jgi:hypothetical protein
MAKIGKHIARGLIATAAGVAAGYYFYGSKDAHTHRKVAAKWATDLKSDVVKRAKKLKNIDQKTMMDVVDSAAKAYAGARDLDRKEVAKAAAELKTHWQTIVKEMNASGKTVARTAKKVARSAAKKAGKK